LICGSQKKNLCFPRLLEAHSQLNRGEQGVRPMRILYAFLLLKVDDPNCRTRFFLLLKQIDTYRKKLSVEQR
jgi:hypothetical protein